MFCDIDLGNSFLKYRLHDHKVIRREGYAEFSSFKNEFAALISEDREDYIVRISAVGSPRRIDQLSHFFQQKSVRVWVASTQSRSSILRNGYTDHAQMGVDRWLAMLGARSTFDHRCLIVLDAGTAITLDFVVAEGNQGGFILPGLKTQYSSLRSSAALPEVSSGGCLSPGRNTHDAIANGVSSVTVRGIDAICRDFMDTNNGSEALLVITGGDGELLERLITVPCVYVKDLVFRGLDFQYRETNPCGGSF